MPFNLLYRIVFFALIALLQACSGTATSLQCELGQGVAVTISGDISYDRVNLDSSGALDFDNISQLAARGVVVEAICNSSVAATATTDDTGHYSLSIPSNSRNLFIRVRAKLLRQGIPAWNVVVKHATADNSPVFSMDGQIFHVGSQNVTRNLHAASGWDGASYSEARVAAPFAILDTIYDSIQLLLLESSDIVFPPLVVRWSADNTDGTYYSANTMTVLGASSDTDEFDKHVIAHEWGHYFQDNFSRDESIGGQHSITDILDIRVAFSEGFGNAFSAIVTGDPIYKDSQSILFSTGFTINVESNFCSNQGWYNECSIQSVLYDLFDAANDDALSYGFTPIYNVLTTDLLQSDALTSLFAFITPFKSQTGVIAADVDSLLLSSQSIAAITDDIGSGRVLNPGSNQLPVYYDFTAGDFPQTDICLVGDNGGYNGLGVTRFIQFTVPVTQTYSFIANKKADEPLVTDPDMYIYSRGQIIGSALTLATDIEQLSVELESGKIYVLALTEFRVFGDNDYDPFAPGAENEICFTLERTP